MAETSLHLRLDQFWGRKVQLRDPKDPYHRPIPTLQLPADNVRRGVGAEPVLRDGYGYMVIDDQFAIFELLPLK